MSPTLCIVSYNSTGFGAAAQNYIETLLLFSNILCLQEHFLLDSQDKKYSNTNKIRSKYSKTHDVFIVPAYKDYSQVSKGRGSGGLATLWNKNLTKYVSKVKCTNYRIQATKFSLPDGPLLVINSYFPGDPRTDNFDDSELLTLLSDIRQAIRESNCQNVLLAGDLNSHFSRNNRFTNIVKNFVEESSLIIFWENCLENANINTVDYTHINTANSIPALSTIDHFASSRKVFQSIAEAGVLHSGINSSNHSAIYTKLLVGELNLEVENIKSEKRVNWAKATDIAIDKYKAGLAQKLGAIPQPECSDCHDLHCKVHKDSLEDYTMEVLQAVERSARECLPCSGGGAGKSRLTRPGWIEYVKPYCDESKFWHSVWKAGGSPCTGPLYEQMRSSKAQYKYAVRRLQRVNDKIQSDKFVHSILKGGVNIFNEIKKFRGSSKLCSSRIDEEIGAVGIATHFANIYSELYNRAEHGQAFQELCDVIENEVGVEATNQINRIDEGLITRALNMMKSNKNDSIFDFQSDCLIHGPPELVSHLAKLLRLYISHGEVPCILLSCTLLPLVKDGLGDITASDNYRAIASGSLILKLLDIVILLLEGDKLGCDSMQFGFQARSSTTMCTWAVNSVIDHFLSKRRAVYGCAMDLSKAFDLVEWTELFTTLRQRGVEPMFLRVMLYVYRAQECDVKWGGQLSHKFHVSNGVRQGAVSSPLLFSVYINNLFTLLRESGLGCHISGIFLACFGYADDLLLLSGSRTGLQELVKICEKFAAKKALKFSTNENPEKSKTKCIIFSRKSVDYRQVAPIMLNDNALPWVAQVKHLGNTLQCDNSMKLDMAMKRGKFIGKLSSLQQEFHSVEPQVFVKILNIYATSFYGSSLWDLYSKECERFYAAWNVAMRICFGVDRATHRYIIQELTDSVHPKVMMSSRYASFHQSLLNCDKLAVRYLARLRQHDQRTVFGRTLARIAKESNIDITAMKSIPKSSVKGNMKYFPTPEAEAWRLPLLRDLLDARNGSSTLPGFSPSEIEEVLKYVCTS